MNEQLSALRRYTIHHDGMTIPVSRGGQGRLVVLCPGLWTTQADLCDLTELLRRDHDVVTFDLRGHGLAPTADRYTFDGFLGDLGAVLSELRRSDPNDRPVLVGYSLGADLAVRQAAAHPGTVAELILIDGANPVPEPFLTDAVLPDFLAGWEDVVERKAEHRGTDRQVALTAQECVDVNVEVDAVRAEIFDRYREIVVPIRMIMSTRMAGDGDDARTVTFNQNWRAGVERVLHEYPQVSVHWVDADHRLVFTNAHEIAQLIGRHPEQTGQTVSNADDR